jgi:hypothetical protein
MAEKCTKIVLTIKQKLNLIVNFEKEESEKPSKRLLDQGTNYT